MESSLVCSFSSFLPDKSKCTTSPYFPNENSLVYVKNCRRNIKNHLKSCNIGDIASEGHLICYRAGVFSLFGDYTICPFHRYSLGIRWKKKSSCSHPSHSTTAKAEVGRSITLSMSRHLHTLYGYIVPIGSGLCSRCRKNVTQEMKWCECCKDASSAQICKNTSDDTPEATLQQSRNLQTRTENYAEQCHSETENSTEQCHSETLSQTDESTTYTLSQESSWSTSLEGQIHLTDGIENLNNTLMSLSGGQVSPIKFQLKTPLREVQSSTRRYLKRKAKEVVHTVLNHLAPGQSSDMFQLLYEDNCHEDTEQSDKTELEITDTILQLYCEAENNALKRQLLSLLSLPNAHSKSKLQKLIPGLTKWEIDQSRAHAASHGAGSLPGPMEPGYRNRMNKEKLEHALSFFLDPKFHQICSYGTKDLHCDNGQTVTIPQVVRTTCHSSLLQMYKSYCSETGFVPLSDSTLY